MDMSGRIEGNGDRISILEFPLRDSRQIGTCQFGEEILVLDGKPGGAGIIYLLIETTKGIRGWISDDYLRNPESDENR
jgi:hypothetical protein